MGQRHASGDQPPIGTGVIWGSGLVKAIPHTYPVPWPAPLVFEKMQLGDDDLGGGERVDRYVLRAVSEKRIYGHPMNLFSRFLWTG